MEKAEAPETLTLDGVSYPISSFSDNVKEYLSIRHQWSKDLYKDRMAVIRGETAIAALDSQLTELVKKELAMKNET